MQRREVMQQRMAASQQAAQGKQPTVKEQVEQKAGLMALQAKQQEMAQQQMAQQSQQQPMPVPPGTPQPSMLAVVLHVYLCEMICLSLAAVESLPLLKAIKCP
jgi:hypothetical protein